MRQNRIWSVVGLSFLLAAAIPAQAQSLVINHTFNNTPDGAYPGQIVFTNGLIYGSTSSGGADSSGSVFTFNTNGPGFTTIYSFTGLTNNAYSPNNLLVTASAIYGTSSGGGTNGRGTVFALNTSGTVFTPLYSFGASPDGSNPGGAPILVGSTLYGTTTIGGGTGAGAAGTIFKINTDGSGYGILHSFTNTPDGSQPQAGLTLSGNMLYGVTTGGGANGDGSIFAIGTGGSGYTNLYSFTNSPDANHPVGGLTLSGGTLYGTASTGGTNGVGAIFAINTNGTGYRVLYSFTPFGSGNTDGAIPKAMLTASGSYLIGTAGSSGSGAGGTLFLINTNGTGFATLASFTDGSASGWDPLAGAIRVGNSIWGTANQGSDTTYGSLYQLPMPVITVQPQSLKITNNNPAVFTVGAADDSPLSYAWYFNTNTLLSGNITNTLTLANANTNNAGTYTVVLTDSYQSITSSPAVLTVVVPGTKPTITQDPVDETVLMGIPASFTNAASGTAPLYYQWYYNTNTLLSGQTNVIYSIASTAPGQTGYYTVVVTNLYGNATSTAAFLDVLSGTKPVISQEPQSYTATNGYNATFTNVASGTSPLFYQWYFNTTTPVPDGTNSILLLTFVATNQVGPYSVIITNAYGSATSTPASLSVISTKPTIFTQPAPLTVTNGDAATLDVVAAGQNPLHYQWYTNTTAFPLAGKTNSTLLFATVSNSLAGNYLVIITNSLGKATSNPALLTVISKPIITQQPQNVVVTNGNPATFTAAAAGAGTLFFQWFFHTNSLVSGATNTSLTFTNAITNIAGYYSVRVTNTFGAVTSSYALLTISNYPNLLSFTFDSASGSPSLVYAEHPKSTNRLWASTNLASSSAWVVIATNVMATNGLWFYTDPNSAKTNNLRFYRFSQP